jgi:hypothetical protein
MEEESYHLGLLSLVTFSHITEVRIIYLPLELHQP